MIITVILTVFPLLLFKNVLYFSGELLDNFAMSLFFIIELVSIGNE